MRSTLEEQTQTRMNTGGRENARVGFRSKDAFAILFLLLLASFVFYVAGGGHAWSRIVGGVLSATTLVLAGRGAQASRAWILYGWLSLGLLGLAAILGEVIGQRGFLGVTYLLHVVLFLFTMFLIVRRLAHSREITISSVAGALCLYVLIGMVFAGVFVAIALFSGQPFLQSADPDVRLRIGDYFYFSFVTMTTTGFGDVFPATSMARALSMVEAVLGQLFLATLVARLVSVAGLKRAKAV